MISAHNQTNQRIVLIYVLYFMNNLFNSINNDLFHHIGANSSNIPFTVSTIKEKKIILLDTHGTNLVYTYSLLLFVKVILNHVI